MTSLQNHVPEVVVVEALLVSNYVYRDLSGLVCDMRWYLDGESSMGDVLCLY